MSFELFPLFPTVVYRKTLDLVLTDEERTTLHNIEVFPQGLGNKLSCSSFILDDPKFKRIKDVFMENAAIYFNEIMKYDYQLHMTNSWLNVTQLNEQHGLHNHTNSIISGCWYYRVQDSQPSISFNRITPPFLLNMRAREFNHFNSLEWDIPVGDNVLVLFPSSCFHLVKPNLTNNDRVSIAFNTFVKGNIGAEYEGADLNLS